MTALLRTASKGLSIVLLCVAVLAPVPAAAEGRALYNADGLPSLAPVLEQTTPAVVNIAVAAQVPTAQINPLLRDPFLRRFFPMPEFPESQPRVGAGSGVIVDAEEGYVLTNHHVVENGTEITVTLKDRRSFEAELVGGDPGTDIALLKIEPDNLTELDLADSDRLQIGDYVVAIGNPFGLGQTVTLGIVSALGRSGVNIEGYEDFIQTDASINPGNSGGALVSLDGRLVGINTAIISPAGGNVGIGFAIPANMARAVMDQLIEFGEVRRGRLGVIVQDLTPDLADALRVDAKAGAVITKVEPDTPAERAGLKAGDIIVAIDDRPVRSSGDLRNQIGLKRVGGKIELGVVREGKVETLSVRLEKARDVARLARGESDRLNGAHLRDLQPGDPLFGQVDGVVVSALEAGSPAARHGLEPGDVIVAVNQQPVDSLATLYQRLDGVSGTLALTIQRGGSRLFLVLG